MDTPRPSPRTNRARRVPHPVLIGQVITPRFLLLALPPPRPGQRPALPALPAASTSPVPANEDVFGAGAAGGGEAAWGEAPAIDAATLRMLLDRMGAPPPPPAEDHAGDRANGSKGADATPGMRPLGGGGRMRAATESGPALRWGAAGDSTMDGPASGDGEVFRQGSLDAILHTVRVRLRCFVH